MSESLKTQARVGLAQMPTREQLERAALARVAAKVRVGQQVTFWYDCLLVEGVAPDRAMLLMDELAQEYARQCERRQRPLRWLVFFLRGLAFLLVALGLSMLLLSEQERWRGVVWFLTFVGGALVVSWRARVLARMLDADLDVEFDMEKLRLYSGVKRGRKLVADDGGS